MAVLKEGRVTLFYVCWKGIIIAVEHYIRVKVAKLYVGKLGIQLFCSRTLWHRRSQEHFRFPSGFSTVPPEPQLLKKLLHLHASSLSRQLQEWLQKVPTKIVQTQTNPPDTHACMLELLQVQCYFPSLINCALCVTTILHIGYFLGLHCSYPRVQVGLIFKFSKWTIYNKQGNTSIDLHQH